MFHYKKKKFSVLLHRKCLSSHQKKRSHYIQFLCWLYWPKTIKTIKLFILRVLKFTGSPISSWSRGKKRESTVSCWKEDFKANLFIKTIKWLSQESGFPEWFKSMVSFHCPEMFKSTIITKHQTTSLISPSMLTSPPFAKSSA